MSWFNSSLNRKFITGTAAGLLISSLVFLLLFVKLYSSELEQERSGAAHQVTRLLQTSLENAMLKRDLEGLRTIVTRLGEQSDIKGVMIANPAGEVRFSSDPTRFGSHLPPLTGVEVHPTTLFIRDRNGLEVLRSINPVHNREPCQECHGPIAGHPVNGILYVDYSAAPIRKRARDTTSLLMGSGALIVVINLLGGWWFIRRFILTPVERLTHASNRLSQGDLDFRVSLQGRDELSRLGDTFNRMAGSLRTKMTELREKEQFLQQLVDAIPDGVRIIDEQYRVLLVNRTYLQQVGIEDPRTVSDRCYAITHGRDSPCPSTLMSCPLQELAQDPHPIKVVHRHQRVDGSTLDVEIYAAPMRITEGGVPRTLVVESIRDLDQEVRFSHEQKLSELGRLAAGVAHEIHNPLASVRLALHATKNAAQAEPPDRGEIVYYLDLVDQEIGKCSDVTERMLRLSATPSTQPELVAIDHAVGETLKLLDWEAESLGIRLTFEPKDDALRVMATDSELRMATLNLAQNAFHAMPDGGSLRVEARRRDGYVEIQFEDTGIGISAEDIPRIFDPFFSRRADGVKGTGLGLSITQTIVRKYQGRLDVGSTPGQGSRFSIRLPDADQRMEE